MCAFPVLTSFLIYANLYTFLVIIRFLVYVSIRFLSIRFLLYVSCSIRTCVCPSRAGQRLRRVSVCLCVFPALISRFEMCVRSCVYPGPRTSARFHLRPIIPILSVGAMMLTRDLSQWLTSPISDIFPSSERISRAEAPTLIGQNDSLLSQSPV